MEALYKKTIIFNFFIFSTTNITEKSYFMYPIRCTIATILLLTFCLLQTSYSKEKILVKDRVLGEVTFGIDVNNKGFTHKSCIDKLSILFTKEYWKNVFSPNNIISASSSVDDNSEIIPPDSFLDSSCTFDSIPSRLTSYNTYKLVTFIVDEN